VRKVKGLIHTARCRTRKLIELSVPAVSGLWLSGGLDSPVMSHLHCFKSSERARSASTLPCPKPEKFDLGHHFFLSPSAALVKQDGSAFLCTNQRQFRDGVFFQSSRWTTRGSRFPKAFFSAVMVASCRFNPVIISYNFPIAAGLLSRVNPLALPIS
jgi:hypothetical protein